jgi:hypothetical protein
MHAWLAYTVQHHEMQITILWLGLWENSTMRHDNEAIYQRHTVHLCFECLSKMLMWGLTLGLVHSL